MANVSFRSRSHRFQKPPSLDELQLRSGLYTSPRDEKAPPRNRSGAQKHLTLGSLAQRQG